jgi:hypothetical protein
MSMFFNSHVIILVSFPVYVNEAYFCLFFVVCSMWLGFSFVFMLNVSVLCKLVTVKSR